jgi:hypothetical protein
VLYLDAGFPFSLYGFPLIPHVSHYDGKKVDLAFFYERRINGEQIQGVPSPVGYWVYEGPVGDEVRPCIGREGWLRWDFKWFQPLFKSYCMDIERTRSLVLNLFHNTKIRKILIEKHLELRLIGRDDKEKIGMQECEYARHDDHLHIELR